MFGGIFVYEAVVSSDPSYQSWCKEAHLHTLKEEAL